MSAMLLQLACDCQRSLADDNPAVGPGIIVASKPCLQNAANKDSDPTVSEWCAEKSLFDAELKAVSEQSEKFRNSTGNFQSAAATLLTDTYTSRLRIQQGALQAISSKLEEVIEVTMLLPMLGDQKVDAAAQLSQLRVELARLLSNYETAKYVQVTVPADKKQPDTTPPNSPPAKAVSAQVSLGSTSQTAPQESESRSSTADSSGAAAASPKPEANAGNSASASGSGASESSRGDSKTAKTVAPDPAAAPDPTPDPAAPVKPASASSKPETGSLTGTVVDDDTGLPIPRAIVIALCSPDGQYEHQQRTNSSGQYTFSALEAGTCLIRSAKALSSDEVETTKALVSSEAEKAMKFPTTYLADLRVRGVSPPTKLADTLKGKSQRDLEQSVARWLPPQYLAYEERTLKNVGIAAGKLNVAEELRLPQRKATIGEFARVIAGFEQSGASSAADAQKFFFDLFVSIPAPFNWHKGWKDPNFGPGFRLWGDIRITSTPQQVQSSLGDFAIGFAAQIGALKVNQIAQASEFQIGGEQRIWDWGVSRSRLLSFDKSNRERFGLYGIASFGRITPLNPRDTLEVFNNPAPGTELLFDQQITALGLTNQLSGKKYIAFVSQDRFKFYKEYYLGARIKAYYYDRDTDEPLRRFPASVDIVFGQNETVTGGSLRGTVFRLDGFYPLPYNPTKFLYLFGTADILFGGPKGQSAILLQPATNNPAVPDPSILLLSTPQLSRDHYRLGVGIDFLQLIDSIKNLNSNKPSPGQAQPKPDNSKIPSPGS